MNLIVLCAVGIGGGLGAVLRYVVNFLIHGKINTAFPLGTMIINISGSFVMGLLYVVLMNKLNEAVEVRAFLLTGILGGYTTFSAFSLDTVLLVNQGQGWNALLNVVLTVVLCLLGAALGVALGQRI